MKQAGQEMIKKSMSFIGEITSAIKVSMRKGIAGDDDNSDSQSSSSSDSDQLEFEGDINDVDEQILNRAERIKLKKAKELILTDELNKV
jgi:hypothetical protein